MSPLEASYWPRNAGSWIVVFVCTLTGFVLAFSTAFGADVSSLRTPFQAGIEEIWSINSRETVGKRFYR